ncbi:DUF4105 domain-containing protein [Lutibacter sp.]|uniref:lipoprotein N-acyltransferase Lnb domain-containing protein n=1 Tax=Lutibacter sp. TaxID=1925666 RepID=UPI002732B3D3|nr:DUF4105 domain-containing protein [Lutibacter sp.]MDP3312611.1 DUF4105 domain-containing protein [Lutibacter sp.]
MKRKIILLSAIFSLGVFFGNAQLRLSTDATISVVTCGPGSELYSTFGHSAFRVYDPILQLDKVYNYGTFNFNAPNFYLNFVKGKLIYQLSTSRFNSFLESYHRENRWVTVQELNLDNTDVQLLYDFLEINALPQNRDYKYDFFYDNCSTKLEEVLKIVLKDKVAFSNSHINTTKTHRDLIADYTTTNKWSKFGIDLALGSVIDRKATKDNYKFLPDYLMAGFGNATVLIENNQQPLVKNTVEILKQRPFESKTSLATPFNLFFVLCLLVTFKTYKNIKNNKRSKWLDFSLFFVTGIIGIVVLLLWFATNHTATYKNFNFLWAFAPNVVVAFYMLKTKLPTWLIAYNKLLLILLALLFLLWVIEIQVFNIALLPIIALLIIRYGYLILNQKKLQL